MLICFFHRSCSGFRSHPVDKMPAALAKKRREMLANIEKKSVGSLSTQPTKPKKAKVTKPKKAKVSIKKMTKGRKKNSDDRFQNLKSKIIFNSDW